MGLDGTSWLAGSFHGPPLQDCHMLGLCSRAICLEATALGRVNHWLLWLWEEGRDRMNKGPDNAVQAKGARQTLGWEVQSHRLKNHLVNFAITMIPITDFVNVEWSTNTMRGFMTITCMFVYSTNTYCIWWCGKHWADHGGTKDKKSDSTFKEQSEWSQKERLYFHVWLIYHKIIKTCCLIISGSTFSPGWPSCVQKTVSRILRAGGSGVVVIVC